MEVLLFLMVFSLDTRFRYVWQNWYNAHHKKIKTIFPINNKKKYTPLSRKKKNLAMACDKEKKINTHYIKTKLTQMSCYLILKL